MDTKSLIPEFPVDRPLELSDKSLLDRLFTDLQPQVSELTFAGLYLFRIAHDYRLTMIDESLVILGKGYDGEPRFLPPMSGDIRGALQVLFDAGMTLYGADDAFVERYLQDEGLLVSEDRDAFDYLYLRSDLAELPGNRYHKKKNRINYFTSRHDYLVEIFRDEFIVGCLELLAEWQRVRGAEASRSSLLEVDATAEALRLAGQLGLEGVVVLADGRLRAFALGERLNTTTSVCHFEKSDPFMEGVSQLVDREFNRLLFTDCSYVNREQDLGEPGLRGAKLSYHPVGFVRKYRADRQLTQRKTLY
ncbi:DUF2156 domain-containing protein [Geobacter pelophilus]|uniref:DUF2156 domain-containing protein n=1 Tax=Geoanaerobacter pelophilus TaxID=60036 RepID=A0AAW4L2M5_9BACT|nr:DUF2156 domain-containing protein [Geoanaerobacter pelophilus]MBT0662890.1 DUF2156 domain-containing protein [Geoanaerobacter pelophilus]